MTTSLYIALGVIIAFPFAALVALLVIASRLDQRQAELFFDRGQRENFDIERDRQ